MNWIAIVKHGLLTCTCVCLSPSAEFFKLRKSLDRIGVSEHLPLLGTDPNVAAVSNVTLFHLSRTVNLSFITVKIQF